MNQNNTERGIPRTVAASSPHALNLGQKNLKYASGSQNITTTELMNMNQLTMSSTQNMAMAAEAMKIATVVSRLTAISRLRLLSWYICL